MTSPADLPSIGGDPLVQCSPPDVLWTRGNSAEAAPGVLTAMNYTFYGHLSELHVRRALAGLGVIPRSAATFYPDAARRFTGIFHGRLAMNVDVFRVLFSGLPGVTGDQVERDILGATRTGVPDRGYRWRLPVVLVKAPASLAFNNRRVHRFRADTGSWWSSRVGPGGPRGDARTLLEEAVRRWQTAMYLQGRNRLLYQGVSTRLTELAARAGDPNLVGVLLSGAGDIEEAEVAHALWQLARGRGSVLEFQARYGFHGPNIGNIASRSWREDPSPIERLLDVVARSEDPTLRRQKIRDGRQEAVRALLRNLPEGHRGTARLLLRVAPPTARSLQSAKTAFLLIMDAARAAARALGQEMTRAGQLSELDDPFFLFVDEVLRLPGHDLHELVARRREQHQRHLAVEIPETWLGQPVPTSVSDSAPDRAGDARSITGLGASPGVAEGRARVILDPGQESDIGLGDILVCHITDPSWVSLMTVADALVIDIGGLASHGAVIAREMGVPCVIGTHTGTRDIHDGDLVRVNGTTGTVEVLARAAAVKETGT